jgi:hypothetical protein
MLNKVIIMVKVLLHKWIEERVKTTYKEILAGIYCISKSYI